MDLNDRSHLVEACCVGLWIYIETDSADHGLHIRPIDHRICKLRQTGFAFEKQNCDAKFHTEFRLKRVLWIVVNQRIGQVMIGTNFDLFHIRSIDVFLADKVQYLSHSWMSK